MNGLHLRFRSWVVYMSVYCRALGSFGLLSMLVIFNCSSCVDAPNKSQHGEQKFITIAVAANMQFAMEALTNAFTEKTGIPCKTTISSSGKLTAQIKEGAPFDVFVSADMKYPQEIVNSGLAAVPPKVYAKGKLVLWSMNDYINPVPEMLIDNAVRHIAIANPKLAPYGMAAVSVLKKVDLLDKVEKKLVYGESIAQTNQFIITGAAEVGFTAMSVVVSPQMKGKGKWVEISRDYYLPIEQGVVLIKRENGLLEEAIKFYEFLSSPEAISIMGEFGYAENGGG